MTLLELIPIGTVLALLTNQVLETAVAARDVLIEKESFRALSKYLHDIEPVLKELKLRKLNDTQAARQALEFLKEDVKKAKNLVDKYKNRARFYLLVKCRYIVREIQDVTRDIGRSLAALSLASTEILSDISEKVNNLHGEMQRAEFEASQSQLRIVEKLDQGLLEQKRDQNFANDMLEEIARAVGVPIEPSEISKELENFKREKEEAAVRKERAEEHFLEQVIELLSRADAANNQEEIKKQYYRRVETVEKYATQDGYIPPLKAFMCPIERTVMVDPVSLCTGTTLQRAAIEAWLESGRSTDPDTGQVLEDLTLRRNIRLKQSIEEWRELNYCLKIRSAKGKLQSGFDSTAEEALVQLREIITESSINKDWIAIEGLIDIILSNLRSSHNKDLKRNALLTLLSITERHGRNKDRLAESGGVDQIVLCLGRGPDIANAAIELLYELLQERSGWNESLCRKLEHHNTAILFLVMLLNGTVTESAKKAETILLKLCDDDDDNISRAAAANWFKPLINRLCNGPEASRISMARTLVKMELVDQNIKLLGKEGVVPPLVEMASGNLESKDLAFSALAKLSSCRDNKKVIATSGVVSLILDQMFSPHVPTIIKANCSEIVDRLSYNDGVEFFVDANGVPLESQTIITNLLAIHQNPSSSRIVQKHSLSALLSICKSEEVLMEKAIATTKGVSIILPLLADADQEIRELALNLLYHFSQHEPDGIADYLHAERRLEAFMGYLDDESRDDLQMSAAGLLAHLPNSELELTKNLLKLDCLPSLLKILKSSTMEAKENALGVLFRFVDPANIEMQRMVVEMGVYPLLVSFLKSGSITAKARAAALIGNLSLSSPKLTTAAERTGCWCFRSAAPPTCGVHGGVCSITSTFCLLKANALTELVKLLQEHDPMTAREALRALGTLVLEGLSYRAANILHEADAISPMLDALNWGTPEMKEEVLDIIEKVFVAREVSEIYCSAARIPLIGLTTRTNENGRLGRKAGRVLAELESYSRSMPLV